MRLGDWIWHILRSKGDCGEKLSLSIFIFVALQVFYLLLIDLVPPTSLTMSLLGTYLLFTLVLVNASIFITIITLNIHWRHPNTHHMPNWVKRWFFQIIPPFVFMSKPHIANAILDSNDVRNSITRLSNYLQSIPIERYPPVVQQTVRDIRYISKTQREAHNDDLVRSWTANCASSRFSSRSRNGKVGDSLRWSSIAVVSSSSLSWLWQAHSLSCFRHQQFIWKPIRLKANTHGTTIHNWVEQRHERSNGFLDSFLSHTRRRNGILNEIVSVTTDKFVGRTSSIDRDRSPDYPDTLRVDRAKTIEVLVIDWKDSSEENLPAKNRFFHVEVPEPTLLPNTMSADRRVCSAMRCFSALTKLVERWTKSIETNHRENGNRCRERTLDLDWPIHSSLSVSHSIRRSVHRDAKLDAVMLHKPFE